MSSFDIASVNKIILGDNLEVLRSMPDESVDLIYLDPPFFSNRDYEVIWGDDGEVRSFKDRWAGGIEHYIAWLKERVIEMHRVLKKTGSFYLHCDWHANAYIRVEILDEIFGKKNYRGEVIWKYFKPHSSKTNYPKDYDTIFFYTKSARWAFNYEEILTEYDEKAVQRYDKIDEDGKRYKVYNNKDGTQRISYMKEGGTPTSLLEIPFVQGTSKERIGYPTQKPEALLDRIIKTSSKSGGIVLDPFCGGGTTIAVADKLGRKWIGIDQSVAAVKVTELRLNKQQDLLSEPFTVQLHKYDYDTLRTSEHFDFQNWIIGQHGGRPNPTLTGDKGVDGWMQDGTPIQVKRSDNIGRIEIDKFKSAIERDNKQVFKRNKTAKKPVGHFIAFSFGKGAIEEVARLKTREGIIIELVKVEDIVPIAKKPRISVDFKYIATDAFGKREIELTAKGESEAGIEFYAWNFDYDTAKGFKADVIRDTAGKQIHKFEVGVHNIAVKVIDNEGLESIETVELHINGGVKRKK